MKLKDIATVHMGYSFRSRLETSEDGRVSVIQMKDLLDDNTVNCTRLVKIDMKAVKEHHIAQKRDLLFRSRGHVSTSAILLDDPCNAVVSAPLLRIRVTKKDEILPEYLNWYISQRHAQYFLASTANGITQRMVGKQAIEDLEIPIPCLEKQKIIVELASLVAREQTLFKTLANKREQYISTIMIQLANESKS
jgi:restriction endonuclease S subunit